MNKPTAAEVRSFAKDHGIPVSARGRISHETLVAFLYANPSLTRGFAQELGIEVGKRGRLSAGLVSRVAASL